VPTFVRVQGALLSARKVAQIATFSNAPLTDSFRDISSDRDYGLAALLGVHLLLLDHQIRILVGDQGRLLGRRVVALDHPASLPRAARGCFLLLGMIPRQVGRQSGASFALEVAHVANETRRVLASVLTRVPVQTHLARALVAANRAIAFP